MSKVIGTYRCGCSYGPIKKKDRLEYCAKHGENIQHEWKWTLGATLKEKERIKSAYNDETKDY